MSTTIKGKTVAEANEYFKIFHKLVTGEAEADEYIEKAGKIAAFSGVSEFPVRVKCASLAWHTMHNALENKSENVTTE